MQKLIIAGVFALLAGSSAVPGDPPIKSVQLDGKIVPLAEALKAKGKKADAKSDDVAFVAKDGTIHRLVRDKKSNLLFLDPELQKRQIRLTFTAADLTKPLSVDKVQSIIDGVVHDVDYWCDRCQLAATEPGRCVCCGDQVLLRELPVK